MLHDGMTKFTSMGSLTRDIRTKGPYWMQHPKPLRCEEVPHDDVRITDVPVGTLRRGGVWGCSSLWLCCCTSADRCSLGSGDAFAATMTPLSYPPRGGAKTSGTASRTSVPAARRLTEVALDPVVGDGSIPFLEDQAKLRPGQMRAQAAVHPAAEGQLAHRGPIGCELVGLIQRAGVSAGRRQVDLDGGVGRDVPAPEVHRAGGDPRHRRHRQLEAEYLLDHRWYPCWLLDDLATQVDPGGQMEEAEADG